MNPISSTSVLTDYYVPGTGKPTEVILEESAELQELALEIAEISVSPSAIVNISPAAIRALEQAVNNL